MAGAVGGRGHHRLAERGEDIARHFVRRHADGDRVETGRGQVGHRAIIGLGKDERERPRPERFRKLRRFGVKVRQRLRGPQIEHMGDEGIECRPALGLVEQGDGLPIGGVGARFDCCA